MANIQFYDLKIEKFSCIDSALIKLKEAGLCCIEGRVYSEQEDNLPDQISQRSNGAGKSSIVEAFYFCLTGEFFDSDTTLVSIINRFSTGGAELTITGNKEGEEFSIKRSIVAKTKASRPVHTLEFTVGDQNIHEQTNSISQTQEKINDFLGLNSLLLLNSRIFGQGDISSFTNVNDRHKKIIIDNLVGVGICDRLCRIAKSTLSEITTAATTLNIEMMTAQENLDRESKQKEELIIKEQKWKEEKDKEFKSIHQSIQDIENSIRSEENKITALETKKKQHEKVPSDHITTLEKEIEKAGKLKEVVAQKLEESTSKNSLLKQEKNYYLGQVESKLKSISELTTLYKKKGGVCPTCLQKLDLETYESIVPKLNEQKEKITKEVEKREEEIEEETKEIVKWKEAKRILDTKIDLILNKMKELKIAIEEERDIDNKIEKTKLTILGLEKEKKLFEDSLVKHQKSDCPYIEMIQEKVKYIKELEETVKEKKKGIDSFQDDQRYYNFLVKAFDKAGIPQLISGDVLKILNRTLTKYKNRILGTKFDMEYQMRTKGSNEEIYLHIVNPEGGSGYSRQSKGEKRKIDLCQMLSLSDFAEMQNRCNINVAFYDEILSELDVHSCEIVLDIIKESSVESKFIITHKDLFRDEFKNRIIVEKTGSISSVRSNF